MGRLILLKLETGLWPISLKQKKRKKKKKKRENNVPIEEGCLLGCNAV
jgi:hypothetical protein